MIGHKIKELRLSKKLNQEAFAKKIYSTKSTISKWENGKANPSLNDLDQIANIFGVEVNYFISDGLLNKEEKKNKSKKVVATITKANYSGLTDLAINTKWKSILFIISWTILIAVGIGLYIPMFIAQNGASKKEIILLLIGTILIVVGIIIAGIHLRISNKWNLVRRENAIVKLSNIDIEIISKKSNKGIFVKYPNIKIIKKSKYSDSEISLDLEINGERKLSLLKADKSVVDYINKQKGGN